MKSILKVLPQNKNKNRRDSDDYDVNEIFYSEDDVNEDDRLLPSSSNTGPSKKLNGAENDDGTDTFISSIERLADENGIDRSRLPHYHSGKYTSKLEIFGWSLYAWAAEPFVVTVMGSFVPLFLDEIAQENGVLNTDKLTPCIKFKDPNINPPPAPPPSSAASNSSHHWSRIFTRSTDLSSSSAADACVLPFKFFGITKYMDTSSYVMFTFAASVFFQTVLVILMSGAADRGSHRKSLLIGFGVFGALITTCFIFIDDDEYYLSSVLAILANCAFGGVSVCGNAILAVLASNHESVLKYKPSTNAETEDENEAEGTTSTTSPVGIETQEDEEKIKIKSMITAKISGLGSGIGYLSAFLVQILSLLISFYFKKRNENNSIQNPSKLFPMEFVISFVGVWWLIFQIPIVFLLKSRPSPSLNLHYLKRPQRQNYENNERFTYYSKLTFYQLELFKAYVYHGVKTLIQAFKKVRQLRDISFFLLAWFCISDSLTTINSTAILFAKTELKMSLIEASIIGLLTMPCALLGSILIPTLVQPYLKASLKTMIILVILWALVIPIYGLFGLKKSFEMYVLAMWYGFALGGVATLARSLYSMLIPRNEETVFFALFSITDKGSSILGPVINGIIINKSHELKNAFWFIFALLAVSVPLLYYCVDLERGVKEANLLEAQNNEMNDD